MKKESNKRQTRFELGEIVSRKQIKFPVLSQFYQKDNNLRLY